MSSYNDTKVRVFFSYSEKDKSIVGELTEYLEALGLAVFAAHDKLELSDKQQRIIQALRECDVYIALLTKRFRKSVWTDQEFGMALAWDKLIVPISSPTLPHGFMRDWQAKRLDRGDVRPMVVQIGKAIASHVGCRRRFRRELARTLGDQDKYCFNYAIAATLLLNEIDGFTVDQINAIIRAATINDQIYNCVALNNIRKFYARHREAVTPEARSAFKRILAKAA